MPASDDPPARTGAVSDPPTHVRLILCLAGAVLGVGAAFSAVKLLSRFRDSAYNLPAFINFSVDLRALGAAAMLSILVSFLIGVIPARKSLKVNLQEELQSEGKGHSHSAGTAFTRSFLVVSAIFFSVVLLIGAGLLIRSLRALIHSDPGYQVERVMTAQFELPSPQYKTDEPVYLLYKQVIEKARTLPDVEDAGLWAPGMFGSSFAYRFIVPKGRSLEAPEDKIRVYDHRVSPNFLRKLVIGIYSILIYTVRQQSFEIGIRIAIGADQSDILRQFVRKGAMLLAIGLVTGLVFSLGLAKTMASILFNVDPYDPFVFLIVPCIIAVFSLPAILRPAYRATKADPSSLFRLK